VGFLVEEFLFTNLPSHALGQIRKEKEQQERHQWDLQQEAAARAAALAEREKARQQRELARRVAIENQQKAKVDKERLRHLSKEVYTNKPTEGYFKQFNTSTR
jgi:hypothetical protein